MHSKLPIARLPKPTDKNSSNLTWVSTEYSAGYSLLQTCLIQTLGIISFRNLTSSFTFVLHALWTTLFTEWSFAYRNLLSFGQFEIVPYFIFEQFSSILRHLLILIILLYRHSRSHRLPLGKRKAALAEWEHVTQLGIIRRLGKMLEVFSLHLESKSLGNLRPCKLNNTLSVPITAHYGLCFFMPYNIFNYRPC